MSASLSYQDTMVDQRLFSMLEKHKQHHTDWHLSRSVVRFLKLSVQITSGSSNNNPSDVSGLIEPILDLAKRNIPRRVSLDGQEGSGLDFLCFHHSMMHMFKAECEKFGIPPVSPWVDLPTEINDPQNPIITEPMNPYNGEFPEAYRKTLISLKDDQFLLSFTSDDELGIFIETLVQKDGITKWDFAAHPEVPAPGIHNFMHNRFSLSDSPADMGDPLKNTFNERFWRLHGWIDSIWMHYRKLKELPHPDCSMYMETMPPEHEALHEKALTPALSSMIQTSEIPSSIKSLPGFFMW